MFVIVNNNSVVLGPMPWRKLFFENTLLDDLEITATLPQTNSPETAYTVDASTKILPVEFLPDVPYNPLTHGLNGPYWDFQATKAVGHYDVIELPIDMVKGTLKSTVSSNRYTKECAGTTVTINSTTVTLDTSREGRNIFLQAFQLGANNVEWKFPEGWLTVTNTDLQSCVTAIMAHIQSTFTWESAKCAEIDAKTTLTELAAVVTDYGV